MKIDINKLIEILKGTCLGLNMACESCGYTEDDLSIEELDQLDSEIFECACCGWWYETSEANDVAGEFLCNDCNAEENS